MLYLEPLSPVKFDCVHGQHKVIEQRERGARVERVSRDVVVSLRYRYLPEATVGAVGIFDSENVNRPLQDESHFSMVGRVTYSLSDGDSETTLNSFQILTFTPRHLKKNA